MFFNSNIKILRSHKNLTQQEAADKMKIKRSTLSGYENGFAQPNLEALAEFSRFFNITLEDLVKKDLSVLSEKDLNKIKNASDFYVTGSLIRILATTVDSQNRENIEVVPVKAQAGYASGFADPEYIKQLPTFQLPFLSKERKYRTFQISGDSMLPIRERSWVTGEFIQDWNDIKDGQAYIIVTQNDGVVFKVVYNQIREKKNLLLCSLNPLYKPYEIPVTDISEIWKFTIHMSFDLPESNFPS